MKYVQITLLVTLYFIPPILARRGFNKPISIGSLIVLTSLAILTTYGRFGFTSRFGLAMLGLILFSGLVAIFTFEFSKLKKRENDKHD